MNIRLLFYFVSFNFHFYISLHFDVLHNNHLWQSFLEKTISAWLNDSKI